MLDIEMEPRRGILFIRLSGKLNKRNIDVLDNEVIKFARNVGIRNIVFNLNELDEIDRYGENALINSLNVCLRNQGQMFLCINENERLLPSISRLLNKIELVNDELTAANLINS